MWLAILVLYCPPALAPRRWPRLKISSISSGRDLSVRALFVGQGELEAGAAVMGKADQVTAVGAGERPRNG
jgi:hypothetical protein